MLSELCFAARRANASSRSLVNSQALHRNATTSPLTFAQQRGSARGELIRKPERQLKLPVALQRIRNALATSQGLSIDPSLQPESMPERRHLEIAAMPNPRRDVIAQTISQMTAAIPRDQRTDVGLRLPPRINQMRRRLKRCRRKSICKTRRSTRSRNRF